MTYAVVVPTVGRPTLTALLDSLAASHGPLPAHVVVVDDRPDQVALDGPAGLAALPAPPPRLVEVLVVRRGGGRGPAAARNVGWRAVGQSCEWIVFLDDDVVVSQDWLSELADDLQQPADVAGVQGEITVPLPRDRRPTDWERSTAGLQTAAWITADMGYRRPVLEQLGGFDERFPRAFREDADIALRVQRCGGRLVRGRRRTTHPVRSVDRW
nr:glycosyltransferase [Sporichthyaceae bacterium]